MKKWPTYPQLVEMIAAGKAYFKSDGCTDVPNFNFCGCCFEHDYYYTTHIISRSEADKRLRQCIEAKGWYVLPWLYWIGVRIFGGKHYDTKYDPNVEVPDEILEVEHEDSA